MRSELLKWLPVGLVVIIGSTLAGWWLRQSRERSVATASPVENQAHRGALLYQLHCAKCHGLEGHGDGEAAATMKAPPRDFAARPWRFPLTQSSIARVIRDGIPNTSMPSARAAIIDSDLPVLAAYVLQLASKSSPREETLPLWKQAGFVPSDGRAAPPLEVHDHAGKSVNLSQLRDRFVLLHFWGVSCSHCLERLPGVEQLAEAFGDRGLTILNVCADTDDTHEAQSVANSTGAKITAYVDPSGLANQRFEVQTLPTIVLVDRDGRRIATSYGARDWASPVLKEWLEQIVEPNSSEIQREER